MEENKIAVVIPFFKIHFFDKTMESLAHQTNKRFTVYIGNDASPEDPTEIIQKSSNELEIKYTKFEKNLGASSLPKQWHRCLELIGEEEWVILLGDDDVFGENCIAEFYAHLNQIKKEKVNVIRFASSVMVENGKLISKIHKHPVMENAVDFLFRKVNGNARSSISEHVFKTSAIRKNGFKEFPLAWHTDDLALLEFSNFGHIYTINSAVASIRLSNLSISGRKDLSRIKNKSSFLFYHYLLRNHSHRFAKTEKRILLKKMEKRVLDDKLNFPMFLKMSSFFFKTYNVNRFLSFLWNFARNAYESKFRPIKIN